MFTRVTRQCLRNKKSYSDWPFLKEEHLMISSTCRQFAESELAPIAAALDREHRYPKEQVKKLGNDCCHYAQAYSPYAVV